MPFPLFCWAVVFVALIYLLINLSICVYYYVITSNDWQIKIALTDIIKLNWINMVSFAPVISLQVWKYHFISFQDFTALFKILCGSLPKYNIQGLATYNKVFYNSCWELASCLYQISFRNGYFYYQYLL